MKKTKLINSEISYVIAQMGHFDTLVIADAGLPIPCGVDRIDLAVSEGVPGFLSVLEAVLSELKVQKATVAKELQDKNPTLTESLRNAIQQEDADFEEIPHEEFKKRTESSMAVVRTGEMQPFANIILESGVVF